MLPKKLDELLGRLEDRALSAKLKQIYLASAGAIERLDDMDLIRYEISFDPGSADLSLWEEMAPVIRDTVVDVNVLLQVVKEQLGDPGTPAAGTGSRKSAAVILEMRRRMGAIAKQITELGESMRNPQVVGDRWNLLAEIQKFRTRFRDEIGELVYQSASAFDSVTRQEIVPGYAKDLTKAIELRAAVAQLGQTLRRRIGSVEQAELEDVQWNAQQLEQELGRFGQSPAYASLRAQDKRRMIEFGHAVHELAADRRPSKPALIDQLTAFLELVDSLAKVNERQALVEHDRQVLAACGVGLERADQLLGKSLPEAIGRIEEALEQAKKLQGRDPALDAFLNGSTAKPKTATEAKAQLERFRELLANLPL